MNANGDANEQQDARRLSKTPISNSLARHLPRSLHILCVDSSQECEQESASHVHSARAAYMFRFPFVLCSA